MTGTTPDATPGALDETIAALESGPTGMTPTTALALVDHWRTECANATDADLGGVSAALGTLGDLLRADRLDGRAIGETLRGLSESTTAASGAAEDARMGPALDRLAALLARAAGALGA